MHFMRRNRSGMVSAVAAGVSGLLGLQSAFGQQNPYDQTVFHSTTSDQNNAVTTFVAGADASNTGTEYWLASTTTYSTVNPVTGTYTNGSSTPLAASTAPTAGYAYVDTGYQVRTPTGTGPVTFGGDSLTFIPTTAPTAASILANGQPPDGLFIKSPAGTSITVSDLVLANGGAVLNFNNLSASLNGLIYLADLTPLDGITPTVTGGIIDARGGTLGLVVNSTITGPGQLHVIQTGGGGASFVTLTGSNTFSGGLNLDSSIYSSTLPSPYPLININNPNALGTGTLTITGSTSGGPEFDNTTGASEKLATNNTMVWNASSFSFVGSNPLDMGSGGIVMAQNTTVNVKASTLSLEGSIAGPFSLTKSGAGTLLLNGSSSYTGGTTVAAGTLGGQGLVPGPVSVSSGATLAPGLSTTTLGALTDSGALTLNPGAILAIELSSATSDSVITLTGGVTLTGSVLDITLASGYTPAVGAVFTIIDNQSTLPTTGTFSDAPGGYVTDAAGNTYSVNYVAVADGDTVANDVQLTFVAPVPEPTSLGVIGFAAAGLLRRRARRQA